MVCAQDELEAGDCELEMEETETAEEEEGSAAKMEHWRKRSLLAVKITFLAPSVAYLMH